MKARLAIGIPVLVLALLWVSVRLRFELRPEPPLSPATRTAVMRGMRLVLDGGDRFAAVGAGEDLHRRSVGPVWVSVYRAGQPVVQRECRGATVGTALATCAGELAAAVPGLKWGAVERASARIKVDVTTAEGPVPAWPKPAFSYNL